MGTLEGLFSDTRRALLVVLFQNPAKQYHLRELIRIINKGQGNVQRELARLVEAKIIVRRRDHGRIYFQANTTCTIFQELRSIIAKAAGIVPLLKAALQPLGEKILVAFVFGSISRGEERPDSDVDLGVIGEASFSSVVFTLGATQLEVGREINPVVFSQAEFHKRAVQKEHFVTALLQSKKLFVIGSNHDLEKLAEKRVAPFP